MATTVAYSLTCWLAFVLGTILISCRGHGVLQGPTIANAARVVVATRYSKAIYNKYEGLFVFGDSYVDTGNRDKNNPKLNTPWRPPYGITWPGYPAGRYSDGHVFTDVYASFLNLPLPIPYRVINSTLNFTNSVDDILKSFGTTGIDFSFAGSGVGPTFGPEYPTITTQIHELKQLIAKGVVSNEMLRSSIALLVVAGNDYRAFLQSNTAIELITFIPKVVDGIHNSLEELYELGFKALAVNYLEPVGCLPYQTSSINYTTCNEMANIGLSIPHNTLLATSIKALQITHTNANIIPLDFYKAFEVVVQGRSLSLRPCCEGVSGSDCGDLDTNGAPLYTICPSPQGSLFWDTFHPTNAGWKAIFRVLSTFS